MNICVDAETARMLWENEFPQPAHFFQDMFFYDNDDVRHQVGLPTGDGLVESLGCGYGKVGITEAYFAPTAPQVIDQMPPGTSLINGESGWTCAFALTRNVYTDSREDKCPHVAAAKAFIAWKKGLQ